MVAVDDVEVQADEAQDEFAGNVVSAHLTAIQRCCHILWSTRFMFMLQSISREFGHPMFS